MGHMWRNQAGELQNREWCISRCPWHANIGGGRWAGLGGRRCGTGRKSKYPSFLHNSPTGDTENHLCVCGPDPKTPTVRRAIGWVQNLVDGAISEMYWDSRSQSSTRTSARVFFTPEDVMRGLVSNIPSMEYVQATSVIGSVGKNVGPPKHDSRIHVSSS